MSAQIEAFERDVLPVPLPNEVPAPPDLSQLPTHIVHSATVEMLLQQIEDLSARLKVTIRRNSILDGRLLELEQDKLSLQHIVASFEARLDVFEEKDRTVSARFRSLEDKNNQLIEQNDLLKLELTGLHAAHARLCRYHQRIKKIVRPQMDALRDGQKAQNSRIQVLNLELYEKKLALTELKTRMGATVHRLQEREKEFKSDQNRLTEDYEHKLAEVNELNRALQAELGFHRERSQRYDEANHRLIEQENAVIGLKRRLEDLQGKYLNETTELRNESNRHRQEAKTLTVAQERLQVELRQSQMDLGLSEGETRQLEDQFESLRILWTDAQKQIEELKLQNESMHQLNAELSRKLRETRLGTNLVATPVVTTSQGVSAQIPKDFIEQEKPRYDRIDSLLAEIQSGFRMHQGRKTVVETPFKMVNPEVVTPNSISTSQEIQNEKN